ncbi:hypothetical protein [Sphaerotilus sp.]|uniref:hypothetical protein n=1 Tax=Sphaerotilus sp. TaxID=2093942 RepID=UPI0025E8948B|nr:hypothetical protein [Sphaerotilus sp.]
MISRVLLAVWLVTCCAVLAFTLYAYTPGPRSDAGILFAGAMSALTFPSGLLVSGAIAMLVVINDGDLPVPISDLPPWIGFTVLWFAFCAVGYLQWFKLIPWLWRKIRPSPVAKVES